MPERSLSDAIDRLDTTVDIVGQLVERVDHIDETNLALAKTNGRLKVATWALSAAVAGLLSAGVITIRIIDDQGDQQDRLNEVVMDLDRIVAAQEADRQERILAGIQTCAERNDAWARAMDYLDSQVDNPEAIDGLRAAGLVECPAAATTTNPEE